MGKAERRKGVDFQHWIERWLIERGWRVVNLPIGGRWQRVRDVFGVDLIAKHPERRSVVLWIQATADTKASWLRKAVKMEVVPWNWVTDRVFIFKRKGTHDVEVRRLTAEGLQPFGYIVLGTFISVKGVRFDF